MACWEPQDMPLEQRWLRPGEALVLAALVGAVLWAVLLRLVGWW